ncbi:hypothetical protein [Actinomadura atramentaria]|uniref:hypothetical protein n=1 Tax=Actinomadura atramentaria TaxID=1990 RepID=UPI000363F391|nr:hypothetical protein [Actinomadura atramentaria]
MLLATGALSGPPTTGAVSTDSGKADPRPTLDIGAGYRYRLWVREGVPHPQDCFSAASDGKVKHLRLDPAFGDRDGGPTGYRWVGAFRPDADAYVAIECDETPSLPLLVQVDYQRPLMKEFLGWVLRVWFVFGAVSLVQALLRRRRERGTDALRPMTPAPTVPDAARRAAGGPGVGRAFLRHGTVVPVGGATPGEVEGALRAFGTAERDPRRFTVTRLPDGGGWLVAFPDATVHLRDDEVKDSSTAGLGRQARAKLFLDARRPVVLAVEG